MEPFQVGDLVWSKMKGFCHWPSKIMKLPSGRKKDAYHVYFYGTDNYAWIAQDHILHHSEDMLQNLPKKKYKGFQEAVEKICRKSERRQNREVNISVAGPSAQSQTVTQELHTRENKQPSQKKNKSRRKKIIKEKVRSKGKHAPIPTASSSSTTEPRVLVNRLPVHRETGVSQSPQAALRSTIENICIPGTRETSIFPPQAYRDDPEDAAIWDTSIKAPGVAKLKWNVSLSRRISSQSGVNIGFIGLGLMGSPIAKNLLMHTQHSLYVWNRTKTKCKSFGKNGAIVCQNPSDVVIRSDIIFVCLSDAEAVRTVLLMQNGILHGLQSSPKGKGYIEMTMIDEADLQEISGVVKAAGGRYLECAIIGTRSTADSGNVILVSSGDKQLFAKCEPILAATAIHVRFLSEEIGVALRMKLVFSTISGSTVASCAEALSLSRRCGIGSSVASILERRHGKFVSTEAQKMLQKNFTTDISIQHQLLCSEMALKLASRVRQPMFVGATTCELYKDARRHLYKEHDISALIQIM